ncbi:MAG: hypothetical protein ACI8V2_001481 [Candidatus Latescibacterota bacterium]|jgi:hypothetical protein
MSESVVLCVDDDPRVLRALRHELRPVVDTLIHCQ